MNANQIDVDEKGNCTVIGARAHSLWKAGGFPRSRCSPNNFYVYEYNELPQGFRWEVVGWAEHFIAVNSWQVLVNVRNAPAIGEYAKASNAGTERRRAGGVEMQTESESRRSLQ